VVRFLHISDTHLHTDPEYILYGHHVRHNVAALIDTLNALPYPVDFVLHTGDVTDDAALESYQVTKALFATLRLPIYYLSGNHDHAPTLQRELLGIDQPIDRYDYSFTIGDVQFIALDSFGLRQPGGYLTDTQLANLRRVCTPDGGPIAIFVHHQPLPLRVPWLDEITSMPSEMLISNHAEFWDAIRPAASRLRGVFYGHIHRSSQTVRGGVLFSSAPSAVAQLKTWPEQRTPEPAAEEAAGYCLVTIEDDRTIVQQYSFARPAGES